MRPSGLSVGLRLALSPTCASLNSPVGSASRRRLLSTLSRSNRPSSLSSSSPWTVGLRLSSGRFSSTSAKKSVADPVSRIDTASSTESSSSSTTDAPKPDSTPADVPAPPAKAGIISRLLSAFKLGDKRKPDADNQKVTVRQLFRLAEPEKKPLVVAFGLLCISASVTMLVPLTIGKLIDFFSTGGTTFFGMSFPVAATVLTSAFIAGAAANSGRVYLMQTAGQRIVARLRSRAYNSVLRQEPEFADRSAGDIVSRLNADANIIGDSLTSNLSDGLRGLIGGTVGVVAMFLISAKLTMVMLCVVPPISVGAIVYGRYLRKLSKLTQESLGDLSKTAEEKLNAFKTVTAFNAQQYEGKLFSTRVDEVLGYGKREALASGIFFGSTGLTGNLAVLCLLSYGGHLVSTGAITVGDLTSVLLYSGYVGGSVGGLSRLFSGIMKGLGAGGRVFHLMDRESTVPLGVGKTLEPGRNGPIRFEDVKFTYPSRKEVQILKGINLDIEPGTSVALVGTSGSGKSSILTLLDRFYDPTAGKITFDGEDIRDFTPESWRDRIGVVFQDPVLFEGSVHDNIAYGSPHVSRSDVEAAARAANCDFIWDLPQGFDTKIGKSSLSGGQRQRISIARALVRKPAILLLDEATSALDSASEEAVNSALDEILEQRNITVILAAHRLSSVARAERVVVLEHGVVAEQGLFEVLSKQEGSRFRTLMAAQLILEGDASSEAGREIDAAAEEANHHHKA